MQIFLDNFHHGGKYYAQTAIHQAELKREGELTDQKSLSISSLQTDDLNLDISSGYGKNSEREIFSIKFYSLWRCQQFSRKMFQKYQKGKGKSLWGW